MLNFLSKKTTITLSKALELRNSIEERLKSNHNILKLENSVLQGQKRNYDLKSVSKESATLQDNLITLKLLVQEANLRPAGDEKKCISYYVYLLSEKKIAILNLKSMIRNAQEGTTKDEKGNVVTRAKPVYNRAQIEDWINNLKKESREIEEKLTTLNDSISIEIPFKISSKLRL